MDQLAIPHIDGFISALERAVQYCQENGIQFSNIFLVGGASKLPLFKQRVIENFGRLQCNAKICFAGDQTDLVFAHGAAVRAAESEDFVSFTIN